MRTAGLIPLICFLMTTAAVQADDDWAQVLPDLQPSARYWHAMAGAGEDKVLLQGGTEGFDETWVYDLGDSTWTRLDLPAHPQSLFWHSMVHIGNDQVLLFGGANGGYHDETWIFDLSDSAWTERYPTTSPSARWIHDGMAYIGEDRVLLFGGYDSGGRDDETWIFDLSEGEWIPDSNITQPSARSRYGLSETSMDGSRPLVLFGGCNISAIGETWLFGGGDYITPPAAIADLRSDLAGDAIRLSWSPVTEDISGHPLVVDHYIIYRSADPDFIPGLSDSVGSTSDTFYVDQTAAVNDTSMNHHSIVKAVDSAGRKSSESNRVGEFDRPVITGP